MKHLLRQPFSFADLVEASFFSRAHAYSTLATIPSNWKTNFVTAVIRNVRYSGAEGFTFCLSQAQPSVAAHVEKIRSAPPLLAKQSASLTKECAREVKLGDCCMESTNGFAPPLQKTYRSGQRGLAKARPGLSSCFPSQTGQSGYITQYINKDCADVGLIHSFTRPSRVYAIFSKSYKLI